MFGYLLPFKPMMRMCEHDTYKAVYCGLCARLGRDFGPVCKLTLSYDFVFLSLVGMGIKKQEPQSGHCRCMGNPLTKKIVLKDEQVQEYTTACAMILNYYKVKDNLRDRGFKNRCLAVLMYPFLARARKKAAAKYPHIDATMATAMDRQNQIEAAQSDSIDQAADPTATFLAVVFENLSDDVNTRRILHRLGYLLGRWIYILDAADDYDDDIKKKNYNPFANSACQCSPDEFKQEIGDILTLTAAEIATAYQLLSIYHFQPILENMIYLGLKQTATTKLKIGDN